MNAAIRLESRRGRMQGNIQRSDTSVCNKPATVSGIVLSEKQSLPMLSLLRRTMSSILRDRCISMDLMTKNVFCMLVTLVLYRWRLLWGARRLHFPSYHQGFSDTRETRRYKQQFGRLTNFFKHMRCRCTLSYDRDSYELATTILNREHDSLPALFSK